MDNRDTSSTNNFTKGSLIGATGFAGANLARYGYHKHLASKGKLPLAKLKKLNKLKGAKGLILSTAASGAFGGLLGGIGGSLVPTNLFSKNQDLPSQKIANIKETYSMNNELLDAALRVKLAADMTLPLEDQPAPEPGTPAVQGMMDTATANPASVGAGTYSSATRAAALAKAKQEAAELLIAKQAGVMDTVKGKASAGWNYAKGKAGAGWDYAKGKAGAGWDYAKNNKGKVGGGLAGAAALGGVGAYAYNQYRNKEASIYDYNYDYYPEKLASVYETGVTPEEAYAALDAAQDMYDDCVEKLAFAQELYDDAMDCLDVYEKCAAEYAPIAGSALGGALGATAGLAAAGRFNVPRAGAMAAAGAALGSAVGAVGAPALAHFAANLRDE